MKETGTIEIGRLIFSAHSFAHQGKSKLLLDPCLHTN
jgi:hypothetical protein